MITQLDDNFSQLSSYINELKPTGIYFLVDENTHEHCLSAILANLETEIPFEIIEIEAGEELKTVDTAAQLWEILAEFKADRKALLVNVGGGVVTDLGGFVASTYKRGFKFINIPTTLLGMCDASIGGKTGIDLGYLKNIVGTFAHPEQIFFWPSFLKTLPFTELRSGFAEMLKHGIIADRKHWQDLTNNDKISPENVAPYINRSMQIKQEVVKKDFREQNIRKTLNFGHTVGHAIEGMFLQSGKTVPHGEAVAAGMICETHIALLEGLMDETTHDEIISSIRKFYPVLLVQSFNNDELIGLMQNDKKNSGSQSISFSLPDAIGNCRFDVQVSHKNLISALEFYKKLS